MPSSCLVINRKKRLFVPLGFVRKRVKYHVWYLSREGRFVSADELMDESQF